MRFARNLGVGSDFAKELPGSGYDHMCPFLLASPLPTLVDFTGLVFGSPSGRFFFGGGGG